MKAHLIVVLLPLVLANCLHMAIVKRNLFPQLQVPVSEKHFGANKTFRGFVLLPVLNAVLLAGIGAVFGFLSFPSTVLIGWLLGFAYMFFELPNSLLKRRLGIIAGRHAVKNAGLFTLLDKTDSAFGVVLVYWLLTGISFFQAALLFLYCSFAHFFFSWVLLRFKLKKSF